MDTIHERIKLGNIFSNLPFKYSEEMADLYMMKVIIEEAKEENTLGDKVDDSNNTDEGLNLWQ